MNASPAAAPAEAELEEERAPGLVDRVKAIAAVPGRIFAALFLPDRHAPPLVRGARYGAPLLFVILCSVFAAWAISSRLDMAPRGGPPQGPGMRGGGPPPGARQEGPPPMKSEREVAEEISKAKKIKSLGLYFKALTGPPFMAFLVALVLFLVALYTGRKPTFGQTFTAVVLYMLPGGILDLIRGGAALASPAVTPDQIDTLVRVDGIEPQLSQLIVSAPLGLWSIWILIVGYAAANQTPRWKALVTLLATAALIGLILVVLK